MIDPQSMVYIQPKVDSQDWIRQKLKLRLSKVFVFNKFWRACDFMQYPSEHQMTKMLDKSNFSYLHLSPIHEIEYCRQGAYAFTAIRINNAAGDRSKTIQKGQ